MTSNDRTEQDWRHRAACVGEEPELFFAQGNTGPALLQIEEAKAVCHRCPVEEQCGQWALDTRQLSGVWGGMSEDERITILRRRGRLRSTYLGDTRICPQDKKILAAHAKGLTPDQIADTLGINPKTVSRSMSRLRAVLDVTNEHLADAARKAGLLPAQPKQVAA